MIAEAFAQVSFPILPLVRKDESGQSYFYRRNPKLCTPSDFDYSPYFDIVKYPYFDPGTDGQYSLIKWRAASELGAAHAGLYLDPEPKSEDKKDDTLKLE